MNPTVLSALIGAAVSLIVCVITNHSSNEKTRALLEYRLLELEKKVDKHNNLIERTYVLEKSNEIQDEKIKVINHRIDDLERSRVS